MNEVEADEQRTSTDELAPTNAPGKSATRRQSISGKLELRSKPKPASHLEQLQKRARTAEQALETAKETAGRTKRERAQAKARVKQLKKEAKLARRTLLEARASGDGKAGAGTAMIKGSNGEVTLNGKKIREGTRKTAGGALLSSRLR